MTNRGELTPTPRPLVQKIFKTVAIAILGFIMLIVLYLIVIETIIEILYWMA